VNPATETRLDDIYRGFTGEDKPYSEIVYEKKRLIIAELFVNAVSNLGAELVEILSVDRYWRDLTRHELTTVVSEFMASMPVYRTYRRRQHPVSLPDRQVIEEMCTKALARNHRADPQPFEFVRDLLIGLYPPADASENFRESLLSWVLTFQQYTGAVMAKAVEDTAFYTYNRLIALNEVGGDPGFRGGTVDDFHRANITRLANFPHALLATSTHDTKFSEDVRARLYVLSELADEWDGWLRDWNAVTERYTTLIDGKAAPDALDRYRYFQVLLGAWPLGGGAVDGAFRERMKEHFRKAVSEAKRHTSILQANEAYFSACDKFVDELTTPSSATGFFATFQPAALQVARFGMVNSLAQVVLKCTVPGVPDFYQGNEIWDFSLVDPDNRREIDFGLRQQLLEKVATLKPAALVENWRDGGIKLRLIQVLLKVRREHAELFSAGEYQPLQAEGSYKDRLIAFRRNHGDSAILVVVPRLTAKIGVPPLGVVWDDTRLVDQGDRRRWRDVMTQREFSEEDPLHLRVLFADLPFAVLEAINRKT
jgi:(1->4)-alpha-D-glucan 1-alpha-D-glucosylmutase